MINTYETILSRRSVRSFLDKPVEKYLIEKILKAGMSGPSACNKRPWQFLVVEDKDTLAKMAKVCGAAGKPLLGAACAILICGDMEKTFRRAPEYWVVDGAIAGQNMILTAANFGIGSVWLGTWPQKEKIEGEAQLFNLPEGIVPHSVIAFGYAADKGDPAWTTVGYEKDKVHWEKW